MNSHPYGISELTASHSQELLGEGRRRQLAKTAPPRPRSALRDPVHLVHTWASRVLALAGSHVRSPLRVPSRSTAAKSWAAPFATSKSPLTRESL